MNTKKTALWGIVLAFVVFLAVAVILLSNPKEKGENEQEQTPVPESIETPKQEEPQAPLANKMDITLESDDLELISAIRDKEEIPMEYKRLISLAYELLQDQSKGQDERYYDSDGNQLFSDEFYIKNDDSSQTLGYLVQDINGDGVKDLLFGVNWEYEDSTDHVVFDLYTIKNDNLIHVFSGWWRNRYYLTAKGNFVNEWSAGADDNGQENYLFDGEKLETVEKPGDTKIYPYFIPFDAEWEELEDIDGNGQAEYVIYRGENDAHNQLVYVFNLQKIYEHQDILHVDLYKTKYIDLDQDGENEIALVMTPWVNSMPLVEYAVVKEKNGSWEKLEMYQGTDILDNSFPISVVKGNGKYDAVLRVEGLEKEIPINVETLYDHWKAMKESEIADFAQTVVTYYEREFTAIEENAECAWTSAWGIWDVQDGYYNGLPCLIAEQGIESYSKEDFWGNVFVYFHYDTDGKIDILDLQFKLAGSLEDTDQTVSFKESDLPVFPENAEINHVPNVKNS